MGDRDDRYRPRMGIFGRFWIILALALAIGFVALKVANAHDHGRPELDAWWTNGNGPSIDAGAVIWNRRLPHSATPDRPNNN
jgi:hypothetical protein